MAPHELGKSPLWQQASSSSSSLRGLEKVIPPFQRVPLTSARKRRLSSWILHKPLPPLPLGASLSSRESRLGEGRPPRRFHLPAQYLQPIGPKARAFRSPMPEDPPYKCVYPAIHWTHDSRGQTNQDMHPSSDPRSPGPQRSRFVEAGLETPVRTHGDVRSSLQQRQTLCIRARSLSATVDETSPVSPMSPETTDGQGWYEVPPVRDYVLSSSDPPAAVPTRSSSNPLRSPSLAPPPLVLRKDPSFEKPASHFSDSSEEEARRRSLRHDLAHRFRKATPSSHEIRFRERQTTAKRKRPRLSPILSPRVISKRLRASSSASKTDTDPASNYRYVTLPDITQDKGSSARKARPKAVILPTSERRPSGPATPHPTSVLHLMGTKTVHKMRKGMASLRQVMSKARPKKKVQRIEAVRRPSCLKQDIRIVGVADHYPEGRDDQWL